MTLYVIFIVIVSFKQLLHAISSQLSLTFLYCLGIFPLLVVYVITVKIVHIDVWHELRM